METRSRIANVLPELLTWIERRASPMRRPDASDNNPAAENLALPLMCFCFVVRASDRCGLQVRNAQNRGDHQPFQHQRAQANHDLKCQFHFSSLLSATLR